MAYSRARPRSLPRRLGQGPRPVGQAANAGLPQQLGAERVTVAQPDRVHGRPDQHLPVGAGAGPVIVGEQREDTGQVLGHLPGDPPHSAAVIASSSSGPPWWRARASSSPVKTSPPPPHRPPGEKPRSGRAAGPGWRASGPRNQGRRGDRCRRPSSPAPPGDDDHLVAAQQQAAQSPQHPLPARVVGVMAQLVQPQHRPARHVALQQLLQSGRGLRVQHRGPREPRPHRLIGRAGLAGRGPTTSRLAAKVGSSTAYTT